MEPEGEKLMQDNIAKNFIDAEEYPMSAELQVYANPRWCMGKGINDYGLAESLCQYHRQYVHFLQTNDKPCLHFVTHHPLDLFNAPKDDETGNAIGTSTVGSSEAIILSTLAMKRRWQLRRKAEGKSTDKPNLVMGSNVQVCWEKVSLHHSAEHAVVNAHEIR